MLIACAWRRGGGGEGLECRRSGSGRPYFFTLVCPRVTDSASVLKAFGKHACFGVRCGQM